MAAPMAGTRWVNMLSYFIAMMFASHLGHTVLAALALINVTYIFLYVVGLSILYSLGVVAAQYYGAKQFEDIGRVFQQAVLLSLIITVPIAICYYHVGGILQFLDQSPQLLPYVTTFFHKFN